MRAEFNAAAGAAGWAVSNPPIFSSAPLRASLPLFAEAGMPALRAKALALTSYLESLLLQNSGAELQIVTPADPAQRGSQLSVRLRAGAQRGRYVLQSLGQRGVVCDWREPDIIRLAPVAFYNSFEDVLRAAWRLSETVRERH
jgi:kynureninase